MRLPPLIDSSASVVPEPFGQHRTQALTRLELAALTFGVASLACGSMDQACSTPF